MTDIHIDLQLQTADFKLNIQAHLPGSGISGVFGASGSGKTTLLRCLAGLEKRAKGTLQIGQECWLDSDIEHFVPTWKRELGYVFQEASLFPHLNVLGNLQFGVSRSRSQRQSSHDAMDEAIELLGLQHLLQRSPHQLSGGERQRVAIARALATKPQLLLLDEPLTGLDQNKKDDIYPWMEKLANQLRIPMIFVTHSVDEIARLTQHLMIIEKGQVLTLGPTLELMSSIDKAANFGEQTGSLVLAKVQSLDEQWQLAKISFDNQVLWIDRGHLTCGETIKLRILARDVSLSLEKPIGSSIQNALACTIIGIDKEFTPSQCLIQLQCGSSKLLAKITRRSFENLNLALGTDLWAQVKAVAIAN